MSLFVKPLLCIAMSLGLTANGTILKEEEPETGSEEPVSELTEEKETHKAVGHVESVVCGEDGEVTLKGWAYDPDAPDDCLMIKILEMEKEIPAQGKAYDIEHQFSANLYRPNIEYEGTKISGNYGFEYKYTSAHNAGIYNLVTLAMTVSDGSSKETLIDTRDIEIVQSKAEKIVFDDNETVTHLNMKPGDSETVSFKILPEKAAEKTGIKCDIQNTESIDVEIAQDLKSITVTAKSYGYGIIKIMASDDPSVYATVRVMVSDHGDDPIPLPAPTGEPDPFPLNAREMYRMYNPNSGEHFYTGSAQERDTLKDAGWKYEGVGFVAPRFSSTRMYRLYNPNSGDHHYTASVEEKENLEANGWNYEGVGWYTADSGIPQYRLYNPNAQTGSHHYTASEEERDSLVAAGWKYEGIGFYSLRYIN